MNRQEIITPALHFSLLSQAQNTGFTELDFSKNIIKIIDRKILFFINLPYNVF